MDVPPRSSTVPNENDRGPPELPPLDSKVWDKGIAAAFEAATEPERPPSVLVRLERLTGRRARVLLRAAPAEGRPIVRGTEGGERRAGRYRILGEIARGGVGVVLKGRDTSLGRELAMKVLRDDHAGNSELIQRFVEEAQICGQLQHPGIVPVYELGVDEDERPYFTMRLIDGTTLAQLLGDRSKPTEDRVRYLRVFEQVCGAVGYAHARGVIHRDLKPANILVGSFGEVQVADWGFAKVLTRDSAADETSTAADRPDTALIDTVRSGPQGMESQVGSVMGTPSYMPPEQALGQLDELDERADVFALGAILCEILTGSPPYVGETVAETALMARRADLTDAVARLQACQADAPLVELASQCLQSDQTRRPRDAAKLGSAVTDYLASLETRANDARVEAARATERAAAEGRSRRLTLAFGACVVAVVVVAAGLFVDLRGRRSARIAGIETQIHEALRLATERAGRGDFALADAAVDRARGLLASEPSDIAPELKGRVAFIGHATSRALLASRLTARLGEIRASEDLEPPEVDAAYAKTFRTFDVDLASASPAEIASRVGRGTPLARAVAFALDDWVWRTPTAHQGARHNDAHLIEFANYLDDDPWRHELRQAGATLDAQRLLALASDLDASTLSPLSLHTLALTLRAARQTDRAIEVLEAGVREYPSDFYLNFHLAALLSRHGREEQQGRVTQHLSVALALRPDSIETRHFLVRHHAAQGELSEARRFVDQIAERAPTAIRTHRVRARMLQFEGDERAALAVAEELATIYPHSAPVHFLRTACLIRNGETERAREALGTAILHTRVGRSLPDDARMSRADIPATLRPFFDVLDRDADGSLDTSELLSVKALLGEGAFEKKKSENPETKPDDQRDH